MKDYVQSSITGKIYCPSDCVRIVNMRQAATYILNGVELLDVYASRDFKTNEAIMVTIFDRKKSKEVYDKWCNFELR